MQKPKNVDEYIARAPKEVQPKLKELRAIIRKTVPHAEEKISYGMPYYGYQGRVAYFAAFRKHLSIFIPPPVIQEHTRELRKYETTKATVHFPFDKKLPAALIRKLIKARLKKNKEKMKSIR